MSVTESPTKQCCSKTKRLDRSTTNFCRLCKCNFFTFYGKFREKESRISTEIIFTKTKRENVVKTKIVDFLADLRFMLEKNKNFSERVCTANARKISNAAAIVEFLQK